MIVSGFFNDETRVRSDPTRLDSTRLNSTRLRHAVNYGHDMTVSFMHDEFYNSLEPDFNLGLINNSDMEGNMKESTLGTRYSIQQQQKSR